MYIKPERVQISVSVAMEVVVGATNFRAHLNTLLMTCLFVAGIFSGFTFNVSAVTLPEERADFGFNFYNGDGLKVDGPVLLVRKNIMERYSISAKYKEDNISGASVDVRSQASAYSETREEISLGGQAIVDNSIFSLSSTVSDEPDYESKSIEFAVSHYFLDDLFTLNLGYNRGWDTVGQVDTNLDEPVDRQVFNFGISNVFNKQSLLSLNYQVSFEEGRLDNPYRGAILQGANVPEKYPETRVGHSLSADALYYHQTNTVSRFYYRYFTDSWAVSSNTFNFTYVTPVKYVGPELILESHLRFYDQSGASFYYDNAASATRYIARDKELSDFNTIEIGAVSHYDLKKWNKKYFNQVVASFGYTAIFFEYTNFTDLSEDQLLNFRADLLQIYITARY